MIKQITLKYIIMLIIIVIMYNRTLEMAKFREIINSDRSELVIIYGRRRVGKSTLMFNLADISNSVYFICDSSRNILDNLARQIQDSFVRFSNWDDFFEFVIKSPYRVIILDEFQYIYDGNRSWPTQFQRWWEKIKTTDKKIFLCGSTISTIYRISMGYGAPLYGRKTREIEIEPLRYHHLKYFFENYSLEDLVKTYAVLGGIPRYLEEFDSKVTPEENIKTKILDRTSFLYNEPMNLLFEEFREPGAYISILLALTQGHKRFSDISVVSKISSNVLQKYLSVLERTKIIERDIPVTENAIGKKNTRYSLKDQFYIFWFRYIFHNQSMLNRGSVIPVYESIMPDLNTFIGKAFERICKDYVALSSSFEYTKIGSWWLKDNEIDIVALNENKGEILFGECKWSENVDPEKILQNLIRKSKLVDWKKKNRSEKYILFAKTFRKTLPDDNVILITLNQLFQNLS